MDDEGRLDPEIAGHYAAVPERERLADAGNLERVRTWELLTRHLPGAPAVVLDVGGGAGVYALPLAARGHQVHLVDPVALHVEQALAASREQAGAPLASATVGDARRLDRPDAGVDAVLLLGPLYHLTERADRVRALAEARRVVRPGGVVVAAAISRFASTVDGLARGRLDEPGVGVHLPDELAGEVADAGLRLRALLAVEGVGEFAADAAERLADPGRRERLLGVVRRVEAEPSLLGASPHILAIAGR